MDKEVEEMLDRMSTDVSKVYITNGNREMYEGHSPENKKFMEHEGLYSIQALKDKIGRIHGWKVVESKFDPDTKSITFTFLADQVKTINVKMSYEDICKELWMKSFEILGPDTYKPVFMTLEERDAIEKPLLEATKKRLAEKSKKKANEAA